jgi:hypothetical protein
MKDIASRIRLSYDELKGIESLDKKPEPGQARKALIQLRDAVNELLFDQDFLSKLGRLLKPEDKESIMATLLSGARELTYGIALALALDQLGGDVRLPITNIMTTHQLPALVQLVERLDKM